MSQEMYFSRMQKLLKDEYNAYIESLSKPLYRGMRINLKRQNWMNLIIWIIQVGFVRKVIM